MPITIYGSGEIGDKNKELIEKKPELDEVELPAAPFSIIAQSLIDTILQDNDLGETLSDVDLNGGSYERILSSHFPPSVSEAIKDVIGSYGDSPLVVRSSALGEARGNGIYHSTFVGNRIEGVQQSFLEILASYFSDDAIAFRSDTKTAHGFGISIAPIVGQDWLENNGRVPFAPALSGYAYTSTATDSAIINISPGLAGGVETRDGVELTRRRITRNNPTLGGIIKSGEEQFESSEHKPLLYDGSVDIGHPFSLPGLAYEHDKKDIGKGQLNQTIIGFDRGRYDRLFLVQLLPFFESLDNLESRFRKPQYIEWAMNFERQGQWEYKPVFWTTQIADVDKNLRTLDFSGIENVLYSGHSVIGTREMQCTDIAYAFTGDQANALWDFNSTHSNYVLVYSNGLTTRTDRSYRSTMLRYNACNNAACFIEVQDGPYRGDPEDHLLSRADITGKLFGVLDKKYEENDPINDDGARFVNDLPVYKGPVKVIGSERQNKIVISKV